MGQSDQPLGLALERGVRPRAWITEGGSECLQRGDGPIRAIPTEDEDCGFTVPLYGGADFDALREAARAFYNATVGQPGMRLTTADEALRDEAKAAGERLRALLVASGPNV